MKKIYDEGTLGPVFNIETRVHGSRGIPGDWRNAKVHGGGMVLDWGVHMLDQIMMMVEKPLRSVYAILSHVTNDDVDDGFKIFLDFEGGLNVQVEVGTSNFINLPRWYMQGLSLIHILFSQKLDKLLGVKGTNHDHSVYPFLYNKLRKPFAS